MTGPNDRPGRLSLQQIEHDDWGDPSPDDTRLVTRCMLLRRKPLDEFDDEDLRIMIGQQISLTTLIPMALSMLRVRPWLGGDLLPAALLAGVTRAPDDYWRTQPEQAVAVERIIDDVLVVLANDPGFVPETDPDASPGDVLSGVLGIPARYWLAHPGQYETMRAIIARASSAGLLSESDGDFIDPIFSTGDVQGTSEP